jgi:GTP-binding protein HflX
VADPSQRRERAFLIGIDSGRRPRPLQQAKAAREAAASSSKKSSEQTDVSPELPFSAEDSIAELQELASSAGAEVVGQFLQRKEKPDPATLIGSGKLEEIAGAAASAEADLILFDHDLSPSQQRNIEKILDARVIDRTQLILDIFARHARTREGQLQVELAQLEYMLPRLTGRGIEMSQLGGGIGTRGPGETQLETDRRKIYRRIRHVKEQLEKVRRIRQQQRQRRESAPIATVALVGYTNAGKSTLFNAMTNAGVLSSSKMFATLDPTLRSVTLPSKRKILVSDTVGFIRNLPHALVTSFRATLEEVQRANLVLEVSDITNPHAREQHEQVEKVLAELEAQNKPRLQVRNKIDLLPPGARDALREDALAVNVSAAKGTGIENLLEKIDSLIVEDSVKKMKLRVPQSEGKILAMLEADANILKRSYRSGFAYLEAELPESVARRVKEFLAR